MKLAVATLCLGLALSGCGGDRCTFETRCVGNVLESCTQSSVTVKPSRAQQDCGADATCVTPASGPSSCVAHCDQSFVAHCDNQFAVVCDSSSGQGLVSSVDCSAQFPPYCDDFGCSCGGICLDDGHGNVQCQPC